METRLIILDEVESTQDAARDMALAGEPEGLAVMALKQTRGRGRLGRSWISPGGKNLALSWILRPALPPEEAALLGLLASISVAETIEAQGVAGVTLRWPNDVMAGDRKIAGILLDARVTGEQPEFVIVGVGLNINSSLDDFPTELHEQITSLFLCTGKEWDIEAAAHSLLERMGALYDRTKKEGCGFITALWKTRWEDQGRMLTCNGITGLAEGLAADGALLLRTADGLLVRVTSGEASPSGIHDGGRGLVSPVAQS